MPRCIAAASSRSPRAGVAPSAVTAWMDGSERASATTSSPRARKARIRLRPTNPEPPVTKAFNRLILDPGAQRLDRTAVFLGLQPPSLRATRRLGGAAQFRPRRRAAHELLQPLDRLV